MHLDTYMCSTQTCEWVSVYGRENGIVIYTACTAASAVLMRKWAFALVLAGIAFSSSFEAWRRQYLDRRDAKTAGACRIREKKTINKVFNAAVD